MVVLEGFSRLSRLALQSNKRAQLGECLGGCLILDKETRALRSSHHDQLVKTFKGDFKEGSRMCRFEGGFEGWLKEGSKDG